MEVSRFHSIAVAFAAILIASSAFGQKSIENEQGNVLARTHDFLNVAYPELFGRGSFLRLETSQDIDKS